MDVVFKQFKKGDKLMANVILEIEKEYDNKIKALEIKIERLQANKKIIISSMKEDIGNQGFESSHVELKAADTIIENKAQPIRSMSIRDRLLLSLEKMPLSGFKTSDLFTSVVDDGYGKEFNKNRASKVFKTLIDEGMVCVDQPRSGTRGGIYRKVVNGQQSPSSPVAMIRTKGHVSDIRRISDALDRMEGEFTSTNLFDTASKDGRGSEIPKTSFHPRFSKMIKEGSIIVVSKQHGGYPGIYKRTDKNTVESSSDVQEQKLF
jgi:hypothetical protein